MARADTAGLFWDDTPPPKPPKKEAVKRTPPARFWEEPDYLPRLDEALAYQPDLMTDHEILVAAQARERFIFDIEVYPNYCLFAFRPVNSKKMILFEWWEGHTPNLQKLRWLLGTFCLINFNGLAYDFPVSALAVKGLGPEPMWEATRMLINERARPKDVYKYFKVKKIAPIDQIDLIELTALAPGLKKCAARLHAKRLQDLPFKPGTYLSPQQMAIVRWYCGNDLDNTELLYHSVIKQIELREQQGIKYGVDLRSRSDAQMAEDIISSELKRITGQKYLPRTTLPPGTAYKYQTPAFIKFTTPLMNHLLGVIQNASFKVSENDGSIVMPPEVSQVFTMGNSSYKFGVGGLHSQEKSIAHVADENYFIADTDATSYYPRLILNAGLTPDNLGKDFLVVYDGIVVERVTAKAAGDIIVAECLKIVANGTFGKLGSKWSIVYAPNLMLQVTITGQLSIAMLAERFELAGIEVTSVNTDGIVVKCLRSMEHVFKGIVAQWESDTGFGTEEVRYKATYSKDINNYIAVYEEPQKGEMFKLKGLYAKTSSKKNAVNEVCILAVKEFIAKGIPVAQTIKECRKISMFTTMREVAGGAVKGDQYLGKVVRWYYATGEQGEIIYAKTGNRVARSEGAKPCMDLPDEFPEDIDYSWYEAESIKILTQIGYLSKQNAEENQEDAEEDAES